MVSLSILLCIHTADVRWKHVDPCKGTIQQAPRMHVISIYFRLNVCKLHNGPIRLLADHDFTVRIDVFKLNRLHAALDGTFKFGI